MKSPRQDAVWVSSRWPRGARVFYLIFFWTIARFFPGVQVLTKQLASPPTRLALQSGIRPRCCDRGKAPRETGAARIGSLTLKGNRRKQVKIWQSRWGPF